MSAPNAARSIEFRNATLGATIAVLRETEPARLADALHLMLGGMPDFFNGEAAVLDFSGVTSHPERIDWVGLASLFRRYRLQPVGVRSLPEEHAASARQAGLAILDGAELRERQGGAAPAPQARPEPAPATQPAPAAASALSANTLYIDRPLRSGQQVYARGGDLVLLAGVSNGSEVIADGSIHCYGPLRGRALAGAQGNTDARIVTTNFGPELVSIAGIYRTFEQGIPAAVAGRATLVRLTADGNEQKLDIASLQLG
ncbi:septum site-determining protein MinC [Aromatoleum evansii]|uniref:Probable septum site-determining protein MinC n=1 Tax=Aromatoleum evansii TaxID=59406 RepID=A0ABZ1ASV0_AROEV|nr:septum site-determining protein MinC [Aromatoleum evansii]NMG27887.1 septum site-determining protein MinC [Aromatoleum evansii]WRL47929.1 septum site-determining protein MinC [Aromatoleum evansii]